jgi:hypothetical protein
MIDSFIRKQMTICARIASTIAILTLCGWCLARPAAAEIVCADDLSPEGMAVTTTGTSPACTGSCRAREIEPVCGPVMKICAGQPIPNGYVLDSVTSTPACSCLGLEDNAYIIRYAGARDGSFVTNETDPYLSEEPDPSVSDRYREEEDQTWELGNQGPTKVPRRQLYPYGDPPFGNVLCAEIYSQPYRQGPAEPTPPQTRFQSPSTNFQVPEDGSESQPSWAVPSPPPSWNSPDQQSEPFRVGQ